METLLKILPLVVVVLAVIIVREGLSFFKYKKHCKLHDAAKTDQIDTVRRLLKEGHPVNAGDPSFGLTPLHFAVRNGCVEIAQLLLEHGADLNQPSTNGITPLNWASEYLDPDQLDTLLQSAASDKGVDEYTRDGKGRPKGNG